MFKYPNSKLFRKNREIILRDKPLCNICKKVSARVAHHIDLKRDNHSLDNLMPVCYKCHSNIKHKKYNYNIKMICKNKYGKTLAEISRITKLSSSNIRKRIFYNKPVFVNKKIKDKPIIEDIEPHYVYLRTERGLERIYVY